MHSSCDDTRPSSRHGRQEAQYRKGEHNISRSQHRRDEHKISRSRENVIPPSLRTRSQSPVTYRLEREEIRTSRSARETYKSHREEIVTSRSAREESRTCSSQDQSVRPSPRRRSQSPRVSRREKIEAAKENIILQSPRLTRRNSVGSKSLEGRRSSSKSREGSLSARSRDGNSREGNNVLLSPKIEPSLTFKFFQKTNDNNNNVKQTTKHSESVKEEKGQKRQLKKDKKEPKVKPSAKQLIPAHIHAEPDPAAKPKSPYYSDDDTPMLQRIRKITK